MGTSRGWNVRSISRSLTGAHRRRTPGFVARVAAVALLVVACGPDRRADPSFVPSATPVPATPVPSGTRSGRRPTAAKGEAPCGQTEAPDAAHAAYAGEIRQINATDPDTVVFELCEPRRRVPLEDRVRRPSRSTTRAGWRVAHRSGDERGAGDRHRGQRDRALPARELEPRLRGEPGPQRRLLGGQGPQRAADRALVRQPGPALRRAPGTPPSTAIDDVCPDPVAGGDRRRRPRLQPRPGLNVSYLGFTNTFAPFDDERVRQAIAMGIDRQRIVDAYFPPGSELATHYAPCAIPHGCTGDPWYEFDPILGKETLAAAGYPDGFDTKIQYSETVRPFLPDPTGVATELKNQLLANLGIRARARAHARGRLSGRCRRGQARRHPPLRAGRDLPRRRRVPRVSASGRARRPEFGTNSTTSARPSPRAGRPPPAASATRPMPRRTTRSGATSRWSRSPGPRPTPPTAADVTGAATSPLRLERFAPMTPGDRRQLVWLATAEPGGLYCADEVDSVSASPSAPS